ncbi:MAG: hypothetical protein QXG00_04610 [Candidatus Woesearchaeota archaeon]
MSQSAEEFKIKTFKIPEGNMKFFEKKLNKLIERSKKLNSKPINFKIVNTILEPIKDEDGNNTNSFETFFEIEVSGSAPKLEGWNFIGIIDHNLNDKGDIVNILRSVPGKTIPHKYHDVSTKCDHCGKNIYRKDTFIVEKNGDTKQVGRSCLKDFFGHISPERVAAYAQWINHLEEDLDKIERSCNERNYQVIPTYFRDEIFVWAAAAIRERGFISKTSVKNGFFGITTSSIIQGNLNPINILRQKNGNEEFKRLYKVTRLEEDKITAEETIKWINNHENNSDFIFNLKQLVKLNNVKMHHFSFIAAAVNSYIKERDKIIYENKQKEKIIHESIGKIGERVTFYAEVINVKNFQGKSFNYYDSGARSIYTMKTKDNKIVVWFSTPGKMKKGEMVTITGIVEKIEVNDYHPFKGCLKSIIKYGKIKNN